MPSGTLLLKIGNDISDNNYGEISTIKKMQKIDMNGKMIVILYSILTI